MDNERSGPDVDMELERLSMTDFLKSPSSRAEKEGAASERLEEPEVDTVESDDEDACVGWPRRGEVVAGACCCCRVGVCWAEVDLFSWRSWGVLEKA